MSTKMCSLTFIICQIIVTLLLDEKQGISDVTENIWLLVWKINTIEFFIVNPIVSDLAILCRLGL